MPAQDVRSKPLFIFEMANNHSGSVAHGIRIIEDLRKVSQGFPFNFAVKLQYRDLDSFIHPDYKSRNDLKFVKRFMETRLSWDDFKRIKDAIDGNGFVSICTPFDEISVDRVDEHNYDFIKIPSCSCTDWPLLERIVKSKKPVICSVAGAPLSDIDKVVSFFRHREHEISLMHCVGQYPTPDGNLQLNQIPLLKARYPGVEVGYSTHERPDNLDAVKIAMGMGASLFEKHVGVETDAIRLNAYSANPDQVRRWLESAAEAYAMCGVQDRRCSFSEAETQDLRSLQRGVFVRKDLSPGTRIQPDDVFYAMPNIAGQIVANDMSKYTDFYLNEAVLAHQPAMLAAARRCEKRGYLEGIIADVRRLLKRSKVVVPGHLELEVSHHYGIESFNEHGSVMITVVNREYCKKIIVMLPGQNHPEQYHKRKDETYHVLYGEILLTLDGKEEIHKANEVVLIPRGVRHGFKTRTGTVIEEVSSNHDRSDSFYTDPVIEANENRKTFVAYWMD